MDSRTEMLKLRRNNKIGILMGGLSSERTVSLETGEAIFHALQERGYDAQRIFVDRDVDMALRQADIDIAYIALHGRYGEDGCIQGLLECLGIPYTGSKVLASALAMNKVKAKEIFRLNNLPTPAYYTLRQCSDVEILESHRDFGYPAVVKPLGEGSSVGVEIVHNDEELLASCERAFCFDQTLLVERFIQGQEVSVAILGERAIGAVEIVPACGFYDYSAKYGPAQNEYHIPARLSPERYRGVIAQGERAHRSLGCAGATRVDMIVSPHGNEYILEVNTLPGMTRTSLLPKIADAAQLSFEDLVEMILESACLSEGGRGNGERRTTRRSFSGDDRRFLPEHH